MATPSSVSWAGVSSGGTSDQWRAAEQRQRAAHNELRAEMRRVEASLHKEIFELRLDRLCDRIDAQTRILLLTIFLSHAALAALILFADRLG